MEEEVVENTCIHEEVKNNIDSNSIEIQCLREENDLLREEMNVWKSIVQTFEEMHNHLITKMSLMKFECDEQHLDQLMGRYQLVQSKIMELTQKLSSYKDELKKFNRDKKQAKREHIENKRILRKRLKEEDIEEVIVVNMEEEVAEGENVVVERKMITKRRGKALVCDWPGCEKRFYKSYVLAAHLSMHQNGYCYKCVWPGCDMKFMLKHHYEAHMDTHYGERKYACDWPGCEYRSSKKMAVDNHKRVHTGERPFQCSWPDCSMSFKVKQHLEKHRYQHTGERPFQCQWPGCERRFTTPSYMRAHMKTRHQEEVDKELEI